jgi:hypothetical protein
LAVCERVPAALRVALTVLAQATARTTVQLKSDDPTALKTPN